VWTCVLTYNASYTGLPVTKKNEVIILHFFSALEESPEKIVVTLSELKQGIRQLQLNNRKI
jgi:hypothetical protein